MRNSYYHAFEVGFNWWFVLGPLMLIAVALLAFFRYKYNDSLRIVNRYSGWLVLAAPFIVCPIFTWLLFKESLDGAMQKAYNLMTSSVEWAGFLEVGVIVAILAVGVAYGFLAFYLAAIVQGKRVDAMRKKRDRIVGVISAKAIAKYKSQL